MDDNLQEPTDVEGRANGRSRSISLWVLVIQAIAWITLVIGTAWVLTSYPHIPSIQNEHYPIIIASALALVVATPVMALLIWALVRKGLTEGTGGEYLLAALLKSAAVAVSGTIVWLAVLVLIDIWRLSLS